MEKLSYYRLPCTCKIIPQYLPLNGGERKITCNCSIEWLIKARIKHITEFEVQNLSQPQGEASDYTVP